ncbi:PKD domain-containing protein [Chitinophaga sp. Cy-1792]|uniref:PKD domain-containing protein n=1 Tax=Chitinophaga sp. Cy-1792 TaxID=2608339 RepID=UPI002103F3EB|nr:PKD domain-containing protein [Chitinophaga sp. Cy-1792]
MGSYPKVDFGPVPYCLGANQSMTDETQVTVGTPATWSWQWDDGTSSTGSSPAPPYTQPGPHAVALTVTTTQGCSSSATKTVLFSETPDITATGSNVCLGVATDFSSTNETPGIAISKYVWKFGDGQMGMGQSLQHQYADTGLYQATMYGLSSEGCASPVVPVPVKVNNVYAQAGKDTIIAVGQPLQLQAGWTQPGVTYHWQPATGLSDPYSDHPVAYLQSDQTYGLTLTSPEGCTATDFIHIKVYTGPEFYVPNAFTPNNDGRNDVFRAIAPGVQHLDFFCVWNRWGQLVFKSTDLPGGWDGTVRGQPAPADTYVWMVEGVDYLGRRFSRKGTVTLIR